MHPHCPALCPLASWKGGGPVPSPFCPLGRGLGYKKLHLLVKVTPVPCPCGVGKAGGLWGELREPGVGYLLRRAPQWPRCGKGAG